jgi:hypothetical protein
VEEYITSGKATWEWLEMHGFCAPTRGQARRQLRDAIDAKLAGNGHKSDKSERKRPAGVLK